MEEAIKKAIFFKTLQRAVEMAKNRRDDTRYYPLDANLMEYYYYLIRNNSYFHNIYKRK